MGDEAFERARRRIDRERIEFAEEIEAAEIERDAARLDLLDRLAAWTEAGSDVGVELRGGGHLDGLVIARGADHVVLDDTRRGEVLVMVRAVVSAAAVRSVAPRRVERHDRSAVAALREALAMERPLHLETDGHQLRTWTLRAVASDHVVVVDPAHGGERLLALAHLDVIGFGPGLGET